MKRDPGQERKTTYDILVWDTRNMWFEFREWPTYRWRGCAFQYPELVRTDEGEGLHQILSHGWEVVSSVPVNYGFLWMNQARSWTFRKQVITVGRVPGVTSRETPGMPPHGVVDGDGYPAEGYPE